MIETAGKFMNFLNVQLHEEEAMQKTLKEFQPMAALNAQDETNFTVIFKDGSVIYLRKSGETLLDIAAMSAEDVVGYYVLWCTEHGVKPEHHIPTRKEFVERVQEFVAKQRLA